MLARRKAAAPRDVTKQLLPLVNNSIDKPRISRNLPSSSSCFLPKISGSGGSGRGRRVTIAETDHRRANSSGSIDKRKAAEGLTVRSAALRPISDPLLDILSQIHKIVMISDLSPPESTNHKRRVVEQFRRRLFNTSSSAELIKKHLRKLSTEAHEEIDLDLGYSDFRPVLADIHMLGYTTDQKVSSITYEQLSACIQLLIKENF
ncbi:unnamed protein product [Heligmosomoides polygyrus]|uniref:CDT1 domain-containing protein n=1 Tax=Heligmosomoides polygyrus TaxID=6339 RepID=A0A183FU39_HELPZ|nr:unnamed protein product [Heligmosomoides polygyrus]